MNCRFSWHVIVFQIKQGLQICLDCNWCIQQVWLDRAFGKDGALAFRKLFFSGHPSRLWTDKGTQFYNQQLKAVLAANNVTLYSTENEEKSSIVDRWKRTLKNLMWKYLTTNNTQKYIDVLPSMVEKYNNTYPRSIKLTPSDARNPANYQHVHNANVNARKATLPKFYVGDKVRITRRKGTFEKGLF